MKNKKIEGPISLGINIGALKTVYSRYLKKEGKFQTEVLLSDTSSRTIPSRICYSDTHRLYGDTAGSLMKRFLDSSYINISRLIGFFIYKNKKNIYNEEFKYIFPSSFNQGLEQFKIYNNEYVDASTIIADYLYLINNYYFKEKELKYDYCTFSVPDYFTAHQKLMLKHIAEAIEMKDINIINESTAITIYYGYTRYKDIFMTEKNKINQSIQKNVIFIDIGYSKTSFIYSTFNYSEFKVKKVKVLPNIGGRNFDYKLLDECKKYFKKKEKIPDDEKNFEQIFQKQILRILESIAKGRKLLTVNKETKIIIEQIYNDEDLKYSLTREKFNKIIQDEFNTIKEELKNFTKDISINEEYIIEIAGEIMRYPDFQKLSEDFFNIQISKTILIDECTSVGAALYGFYQKNGKLPNLEFFKNFNENNYHEIGCVHKFDYGEDGFHNFKEKHLFNEFDIENIVPYKEITFEYIYNNINYLAGNNTLYKYILDLKQLEKDNPKFNEMSQLIIHHYYNNDNITIKITFSKNEGNNKKQYPCNFNNSIKIKEGGIIGKYSKFIDKLKKTLEIHNKKDKEFHTYSLERNTISKLLYNLKVKNRNNSEKLENIQSWINQIESLEKKNTLPIIEKKQIVEKIKNDIEKGNIQKDEFEFERKKSKLIEEIQKAKNKTRDVKLENSRIFNSSDIVNSLDLSEDYNGIEKSQIVENEKLYDNLINEINEIPYSQKDKLDSYFDWEEEIEKKKNELKKTEFFLKINKIIEKLKSKNEKYNMFEKIKNQLLNNEIIVEKAFDKLYSLEIVSHKKK